MAYYAYSLTMHFYPQIEHGLRYLWNYTL